MAWLYKRAGSAKWWIGWRANGKQHLQSTETANRAEAEEHLARLESMAAALRAKSLTESFYESLTGNATPKRTIQAEIKDWLSECSAATAKGTWQRYKGITDDFMAHLKASPSGPMISAISTHDVRAYLTEKLTRASVSTVNLERKIISSVFLRAVKLGTLSKNPVAPIKKFKAHGHEAERRNLTVAEIGDAYGKAPNDFWRYMIIGGFYSGLREGDLITLDWRKVNWQRVALKLKAKKTGKDVLVPIAPRFALELKALWDARGKPTSGPLWPTESARYKKRGASPFSRQFYKILSNCGLLPKRNKAETKNGRAARRTVNEVSFHSLRHSFITALNSTGTTNLVAKELAGHSSDLVNGAYTHLPFELIQKAIAQLPEVGR